jgi:hydroxyethylthiazole kinase-like uncharacterized protein yjeF
MATGYLNAVDAAALDVELMSTPGFSLQQLMELAGLAVAEAVYQGIPSSDSTKKRKILIVCGPGNNGGDGLVAARHLYFFRHYDCVIVYPKRSKKNHFLNLVKQCEDVDIPILDEMPTDIDSYDAIVDAIFGFSFQGEPREPFASILHQLIAVQQQQQQQSDQSEDQIKKDVQIISVDVPSGWNVDEGDMAGLGFVPDILISLTAPKLCSKQFTGRHYIGGRFLPPKVAKKYNIQVRNKQVRSTLYFNTSYNYTIDMQIYKKPTLSLSLPPVYFLYNKRCLHMKVLVKSWKSLDSISKVSLQKRTKQKIRGRKSMTHIWWKNIRN